MPLNQLQTIDPLLELIDGLVERHDESVSREEMKRMIPDETEITFVIMFLDMVGVIECEEEYADASTVTIIEQDNDRVRTRAENLFVLDEDDREYVYEWIKNGDANPTDLEDDVTITTLLDRINKAHKKKETKADR